MIHLFEEILRTFDTNKAIFERNNLPAFKTIDLYQGQPLDPQAFEFTLPALFVDYAIDYENEKITVEAHILNDYMEETANISAQRNNGLNYLRVIYLCRYLFSRVKTSASGFLRAVSERPMTTDNFQYHVLTFIAPIRDYIDTDLIKALNIQTEIEGVLNKGKIKKTTDLEIAKIDTF